MKKLVSNIYNGSYEVTKWIDVIPTPQKFIFRSTNIIIHMRDSAQYYVSNIIYTYRNAPHNKLYYDKLHCNNFYSLYFDPRVRYLKGEG